MNIEINPDYLIKNDLTANQFLILQLICENDALRLDKFINDEDIEQLKSKGFLTVDKEGNLEVTKEYLSTLQGKGFFEELWLTFPVSVIRPDGIRDSLRTSRKRVRTAYKRIVKNRKDNHEHIIACLKLEIRERTKNDTMKYMKKLPNWLSSESWKEWEEKLKLDAIFDHEEETDYGTNIL